MFTPFLDLRITDVVDILVVSTLVYTAMAWLRRTQAAQVATGIVILGVFYVVAAALELRLTAWIFQGFFAILVIIIVVIFQEELRQLFERVAVWSLRQKKTVPASNEASDILVQSFADFGRDRIGALVVLPGTQPINRHIQGGIELNGVLSVPLLKSIFDPHSAGHDGAVIINERRVTRFAAHLPLSKDFGQLANVGTRHSAALGLAELTDALCCVVSEERGVVSVAENGQLRRLRSPQELGEVLQRFHERTHPARKRRFSPLSMLRGHLLEKAAVLAVVIGLWYLFIPGARPTEVSYEVPVKVINLPDNYALEDVNPEHVQVTLSGMQRAFYLFDPARLEVTIDASLARIGRRTFVVSELNLQHPKDLSLVELSPSKVKISLKEKNDQAGKD